LSLGLSNLVGAVHPAIQCAELRSGQWLVSRRCYGCIAQNLKKSDYPD